MRAVPLHNNKRFEHGFFLVEVVVATAVIAVVLLALIGAISKSVEVSTLALQKTQAAYLLDEGSEALKFVRNGSWNTIANLADDTNYYLTWSAGAWTVTDEPQAVDGFTRSFVLSSVYRDSGGDIVVDGGTLDTGTRKAVLTVTWSGQNGSLTENLPLYLANINA
jgi:Tfp pilus assembly protein PilV